MDTFLSGVDSLIKVVLFVYSIFSFFLFSLACYDTFRKFRDKYKERNSDFASKMYAFWTYEDIFTYNLKEQVILFPGFILFIYFLGVITKLFES